MTRASRTPGETPGGMEKGAFVAAGTSERVRRALRRILLSLVVYLVAQLLLLSLPGSGGAFAWIALWLGWPLLLGVWLGAGLCAIAIPEGFAAGLLCYFTIVPPYYLMDMYLPAPPGAPANAAQTLSLAGRLLEGWMWCLALALLAVAGTWVGARLAHVRRDGELDAKGCGH